jgi:hypothetical protein
MILTMILMHVYTLGADPYDTKDKKDKPWKITKDKKHRRMMFVHSTKAKLGICEHGVSTFRTSLTPRLNLQYQMAMQT